MKRILASVLLAVMVLTCGASAETHMPVEMGTDLVSIIDTLLHSENYTDLLTMPSGVSEYADSLAASDWDAPDAVYRLLPDPADLGIEEEALSVLPDRLKREVMNRLYANIGTQLLAKVGSEAVAASSVCTVRRSFMPEDFTEDTLLLFLYDEGCPILISYTCNDEGIVSANAQPMAGMGFGSEILDLLPCSFEKVD